MWTQTGRLNREGTIVLRIPDCHLGTIAVITINPQSGHLTLLGLKQNPRKMETQFMPGLLTEWLESSNVSC